MKHVFYTNYIFLFLFFLQFHLVDLHVLKQVRLNSGAFVVSMSGGLNGTKENHSKTLSSF